MSRRSSYSAPSESSGGGGAGQQRANGKKGRQRPAWKRDERYLERFAELLAARPLLLRPATQPGINKEERSAQLAEVGRLLGPPALDAAAVSKRVCSFRALYFNQVGRSTGGAGPRWARAVAPHMSAPRARDRAGRLLRALAGEARRLRTLRAGAVCRAQAAARHVRRAALEGAWREAVRAAAAHLAALADAGDADPAEGGVDRLLLDTVLLHGSSPVLADDHLLRPEPLRALVAVFHLVQLFSLEEGGAGGAGDRWRAAAGAYRRRGRAGSAALLQRRWHELKLQVRRRMRAAAAGEDVPQHLLPAPLHVAIAKRFPHVVTGPLPTWRALVAAGAVYAAEEDEEGGEAEGAGEARVKVGDPEVVDVEWPTGGAAGGAASDDEDLVLIEREIETIDLLLDEDEDTVRPAPAARVKLEPGAAAEDRRAALRARRHDMTRALREELDRQLRDMVAHEPDSPVNVRSDHPVDAETHFDVKIESSIDIAVDCPVEIEASSLADVKFDYPVDVEDEFPVEMKEVDTRVDSPGDMVFDSIHVESNSPVAVRVDSTVGAPAPLVDSPVDSPAPLVVDESADDSSSDVVIEEPQFDPKLLMTTLVCLRRVDELPGWWPRDLARLQGAPGGRRGPGGPVGDPANLQGDLEELAGPRGPEPISRKRVHLPDISEVRRNNRRMLTAAVAPLAAGGAGGAGGAGSSGEEEEREEEAAPPLPARELARVLRALAAPRAPPPPRPAYCCMARRHRALNAARRRAAARAGRPPPAEVPVHAARCGGGGGGCTCCCRRLLDARAQAAARDSLRARILHALQQEEDEPSPKNSDTEEAAPPATETTATNENQLLDKIDLTSTRKWKVKKKRPPRRSPPRSPPAGPPRDPLQEWIHQKTLTSRFFDLNLKRPPPAPAPAPQPAPAPAPQPPPDPPGVPPDRSILSMLASDFTIIPCAPPAPALPPGAIPVALRVAPPPAVVDLCASSSEDEAPGAPGTPEATVAPALLGAPGAPVLLNECARPQPTLEVSPMLRSGPNIKVFQISPDGALTPRCGLPRAPSLAPPRPSYIRVRGVLQARTTTTSTVTTPASCNSNLVISAPNTSNIRVRANLQPRTTPSIVVTSGPRNANLLAPSSTSTIRVRANLQPRTTASTVVVAGSSNASLIASAPSTPSIRVRTNLLPRTTASTVVAAGSSNASLIASAPSTPNIRVRTNLLPRTTASTVATAGLSNASLVAPSSTSTIRVHGSLQARTTAYTPIAPRPSKGNPVSSPSKSPDKLSPGARLSKIVMLSPAGGPGGPAGPPGAPRLLNHSLPAQASTIKITEVRTNDGQRRLVLQRGTPPPPADPPAPPPDPPGPPLEPSGPPVPAVEVSKFSDNKMSEAQWLSRRKADSELRVHCLDAAVPYYIVRQRYYIVTEAALAMRVPTYWSAEGPLARCVRLVGGAGAPGGGRARVWCVVRGARELAALARAGARLQAVHAPSGVRAPLRPARPPHPARLALRCNFLTVEQALKSELNALPRETSDITSIRIVSTTSLAPPQEEPPQMNPLQEEPPQEGSPQEKSPQKGPPHEGPPQEEPPAPRPSRRAARDARAKVNTLMTEEEGGEGSRVVAEYLAAHGAGGDDDDDDDYSDHDDHMQQDDDEDILSAESS